MNDHQDVTYWSKIEQLNRRLPLRQDLECEVCLKEIHPLVDQFGAQQALEPPRR